MSLPFPVDWPTSLRPDYMIEEVKIGCEQSDNGSGEPLLRITCQFKSVQNKLYTVKWYVAYHHALDFLEHQIRKFDVVVFLFVFFVFLLLSNVPVNNFSVILGRSHRFLGIYQYYWNLKVSCSRTLYGGRWVRTLDLSLQSPKLYH